MEVASYARKEGDSFVVVKAAIEQLVKNANKDITWIELRKHKVPFATRKIGMLCNRVSELHFMKPDPRTVENNQAETDDEPAPSKLDISAPS